MAIIRLLETAQRSIHVVIDTVLSLCYRQRDRYCIMGRV